MTDKPFRVEVIADDSGTWAGNALRFESIDLAHEYAKDLAWRWTAVREWRVIDEKNVVARDHRYWMARS